MGRGRRRRGSAAGRAWPAARSFPRPHARDGRDRREQERAARHRPATPEGRRHGDDRDPEQAEDLRPRVEPVDRARGVAGEPDPVGPVVAESAHAAVRGRAAPAAAAATSASPSRARTRASVPTKPASPLATLLVLDAGERVARDRRVLLHRVERPRRREALLLGDLVRARPAMTMRTARRRRRDPRRGRARAPRSGAGSGSSQAPPGRRATGCAAPPGGGRAQR